MWTSNTSEYAEHLAEGTELRGKIGKKPHNWRIKYNVKRKEKLCIHWQANFMKLSIQNHVLWKNKGVLSELSLDECSRISQSMREQGDKGRKKAKQELGIWLHKIFFKMVMRSKACKKSHCQVLRSILWRTLAHFTKNGSDGLTVLLRHY